jgi:methionyl-tRNA formyltransferase
MRVVFFGSSEFAVPALQALQEGGFDITSVVTVPDQPVGREHVLTSTAVKVLAGELGLHVSQPEALDEKFLEEFSALGGPASGGKFQSPDLCVVASYGKIIPASFLAVPQYGFLNIHPSLLPKYRGSTPVQSAILKGDSETGVTIMVVDEKMDHGPILTQTTYNLSPNTGYQEAHDQLAKIGAKLLIETIPKFINGELKPQEQDDAKATFTKIYSRMDGHLDWSESASNIRNRIRALNSNPGTWAIWRGMLMNVRSANFRPDGLESTTAEPGTIIKEDKKILVASKESLLELDKILLEGKKETTALEFSQGHPDFIGSKFE